MLEKLQRRIWRLEKKKKKGMLAARPDERSGVYSVDKFCLKGVR
jgi:hypothetical protein